MITTDALLIATAASVEADAHAHISALLAASSGPLPQYAPPAPYHVVVPQRRVQ